MWRKEYQEPEVQMDPDFKKPEVVRVRPPRSSNHVELARAYLEYRGFKYKSKDDYWAAVRRYMKPAAELLRGHDEDEILAAFKKAEQKFEGNWTLETINKKIDEF